MGNDITVRAKIDTGKAKASLRQHERDQKSAVQKAVARGKSRLRSRIHAPGRNIAAQLTGFLVGFGIVNRITGVRVLEVDPWSEALSPVRAAIGQFFDEALGYSASARRIARNQTVADYARYFGETGDKIAAREAYDITYGLRGEEAAGTKILRQDPMFTGPSLVDLIKEAIPGYFRLIGKSVDYMVEAFLR